MIKFQSKRLPLLMISLCECEFEYVFVSFVWLHCTFAL